MKFAALIVLPLNKYMSAKLILLNKKRLQYIQHMEAYPKRDIWQYTKFIIGWNFKINDLILRFATPYGDPKKNGHQIGKGHML